MKTMKFSLALAAMVLLNQAPAHADHQDFNQHEVEYKTINLAGYPVPVIKDGLYDRFRSNPPLSVIAEVLEIWLVVQRKWIYLEAIYLSPDIRSQLPEESRKFDAINSTYRKVIEGRCRWLGPKYMFDIRLAHRLRFLRKMPYNCILNNSQMS